MTILQHGALLSQWIQSRDSSRTHSDDRSFFDDVVGGLSQDPKQLPPKYFYDRRGSELFELICESDEYYVTRCELEIMQRHAAEMADCLPSAGALVEFGSGSSLKTRLLLDQLPDLRAYIPVDISGDFLRQTCQQLQQRYPQLCVLPTVADFTQACPIPRLPQSIPTSVYFPGSTIGNFEHPEARQILKRIADAIGPQGELLIGIDLQKDRRVTEAAYNDQQGITAAFNLNLLQRINRELGADFRIADFAHEARYDETAGRVEMRLRCLRAQTVHLGDHAFRFDAGEAIRTEYSHKYTVDGFSQLAGEAGLELRRSWFDQRRYCAVLLFAGEA